MTDSARRTLVVIDGHALAYRAFNALPPDLTAPNGEPVNAVYGFALMLLDVLDRQAPDALVVTFDAGRSGRDEIYPQYKAHRPEMDESLRLQMDRIGDLIDAFDVPVLKQNGWEADDLIAALAAQAGEAGWQTLIVSGDTDLFQLVDANTSVQTSGRRFSESKLYDVSAVQERYGVAPKQLADWKALVGDTSDNIPGVPGIGAKSATAIIAEFGGIDEALEHLEEITPTRARNSLAKHVEQARLCLRLTTIRRDAPVELDLEQATFGAYDRERVVNLLRELGFGSLLDRLPELAGEVVEPTAPDGDYVVVETMEALHALIETLGSAERIAFDTETTGTDPMRAQLVGLALSDRPGRGWYVPVGHAPPPVEPPDASAELPTQGSFDFGEHWKAESAAEGATSPEGEEQELVAASSAGLADQEPRNLPLDTVLDAMRPVLTGEALKVAHHMKYDVLVLRRHGLEVAGPVFDTMIAAWLSDPGRRGFGLKDLAWNLLGVEMTPISALIGTGKGQITMAEVPVAEAAPYACADVDLTLQLADLLEPALLEAGARSLFDDVEMPVAWILADMSEAGIAVDTHVLDEIRAELESRAATLAARIEQEAGRPFNIASPKQLGVVLFEELGLPPTRRTKTGWSTSAGALADLAGSHPIVSDVLDWRHVAKLRGTYVDALPELIHPETGRIHTSWHQVTVVTGRLSSSDPNLQNIPVRTALGGSIRRAFVAPPGYDLLAADYSQMELRVLASLSGDEALRAVFAAGGDIHAATAATLFDKAPEEIDSNERRIAKMVNFGTVYGISAFGLASRMDMSREEAQAFIDRYFEAYPDVRGYFDRLLSDVAERGYVETVLGRRRYFPELRSDATSRIDVNTRRRAEREAINAPLQGSAADITKVAMIRLHEALEARGSAARLLLQVHDELLLEVPHDELEDIAALCEAHMRTSITLPGVELGVDLSVGPNWGELSSWQSSPPAIASGNGR